MEQKSMTALVSAFARAYHAEHNQVKLFDDSLAKKLLGETEYQQIATSMADGIQFFNPKFSGSREEALRWIVDHQLSPSPLGRAAFAERALEIAILIGAQQYLIFGAGYDTFAYRQPAWAKEIQIIELDHPTTARDKQARLKKANINLPENVAYVPVDFSEDGWLEALSKSNVFDQNKISFCSLLGLSYYFSKQVFQKLLSAIGSVVPKGSSLVFDYPNQDDNTIKAGDRMRKQAALAEGAKETILASYSYLEMENLLCDCGFLVYEHLEPEEITDQFFREHNCADPAHPITAFDQVNYCLAVTY